MIDGDGLVLRFDAGISQNNLNIIFTAQEAF